MALGEIRQITGRAVHVPGDDIDTDRIIPARFMKCVTFDGLGDYLFHDTRKDEHGADKPHNLNDPRFANATIMLAGSNFGCGSSREHAPQAIHRADFRALVAESFAEIFFGNSIQLGMPCVCASRETLDSLARLVEDNPDTELTIDIESRTVSAGGQSWPLDLREAARSALLAGKWDPIAELLENSSHVDSVADRLAYV